MQSAESSGKSKWLFAVLLCAVGLLINFLGVKLALALNLPLFLDNIGGALAAALGGYVPAIIVGFLTNLINGIGDYTTTYYGSLTVLIAVSAVYFADKGYFSRLSRLPIIILTTASSALSPVTLFAVLLSFSFMYFSVKKVIEI